MFIVLEILFIVVVVKTMKNNERSLYSLGADLLSKTL
jgi:hypothetical protein